MDWNKALQMGWIGQHEVITVMTAVVVAVLVIAATLATKAEVFPLRGLTLASHHWLSWQASS